MNPGPTRQPRPTPRIGRTGAKKVNLALQGGGSHGAFTWGVLDYLLEDGRLDVEAITGTSAGAMNAVVYAEGYLTDGRAGARDALHKFWQSMSQESALAPVQRQFFDNFFKGWNYDGSPAYWWMDFVTHYASPYEFNPLNINPLRDHLAKMVDFARVRATDDLKLFIAATNVQTGKIRVFDRKELTADHVMASACLPFLFQAVVIDGTPYWDGGYMGNPALFPLFYETACPDIVIVQINPIERDEVPKNAREIQNRLNEITFNGTLLRELRAVEFVSRLLDEGKLSPQDYMKPFVHRIDGAEPLKAYSAASKLDSSWPFLTGLRDVGRAAAKHWLDQHYDDLGKTGTIDLRAQFS
jgi:NTE family protein